MSGDRKEKEEEEVRKGGVIERRWGRKGIREGEEEEDGRKGGISERNRKREERK